jgi:hypothetical protein
MLHTSRLQEAEDGAGRIPDPDWSDTPKVRYRRVMACVHFGRRRTASAGLPKS